MSSLTASSIKTTLFVDPAPPAVRPQWHKLTFRDTRVVRNGEPVTVERWVPITAHEADTLIRRGLGGMVRLGRPTCSPAQAEVIARAAR